MNVKDVRDLIQDVLHNPMIQIFNPADVDRNMHDRLVRVVMDEMDIHDMKVEQQWRVMANRMLGSSKTCAAGAIC